MRAAGFLLAATIAGACVSPQARPSASSGDPQPITFEIPPAPAEARTAIVLYVQDGDSFRVEIDGQEERVRLIGINSPEQGECFGRQARALLDDLIGGQHVLVGTDVEEFDQYGRILGYVWSGDVFVNAELVRQGAALARGYEPNTTLQAVLDGAEQIAQEEETGMWSSTACGSTEHFEVTITGINADAIGRDNENLNGEWVTIESNHPTVVDLSKWTVRDESSVHRYTFGSGVLIAPGESLVLYTGCGPDRSPEFYWCNDTPVWDNAGDTGFLLDANGSIVAQYGY